MSQVLKTNHIPLLEPGDLEPEIMESLPMNTPCPGQSFISFSLAIVANFQVVILAGSAQGIGIRCGH